MRNLIVATIVAAGVAVNAHACPIGSSPRSIIGATKSARHSTRGRRLQFRAPLRTARLARTPEVDAWGNKMCQSFNGGAQYYDTSGGCPIGTYQWVDNWGNKICRSL